MRSFSSFLCWCFLSCRSLCRRIPLIAGNAINGERQVNQALNARTKQLVGMWIEGAVVPQVERSHVFQVAPQQGELAHNGPHKIAFLTRYRIVRPQLRNLLTNISGKA